MGIFSGGLNGKWIPPIDSIQKGIFHGDFLGPLPRRTITQPFEPKPTLVLEPGLSDSKGALPHFLNLQNLCKNSRDRENGLGKKILEDFLKELEKHYFFPKE